MNKDWSLLALGMVYAIALTAIIMWVLTWWVAFPSWTVTIHFNRFHEAWVEGIVLHLGLVFLLLPSATFILGREGKK